MLPNEHIHLFGLKSSATQPISLEQTAGDIFVNALTLYWQNFRVFFLIYLVPSAPFIVIELWAKAAGSEGLAIGAEILSFFVLEMAWAATVIGVSEVCLGGNPTVSGSYSHLTRVLGSFITAFLAIQLCYVALAALGSIPLFLVWLTDASISWLAFGPLLIGSIYTIVLLIFALPVAILEKRRGFSAIQRSIQLSKGYWLRNFGIIMLPLILIIICQTAIVAPILIFGLPEFLIEYLITLLDSILTPLVVLTTILLYYDMRAKKELYNLRSLEADLMV